MTARPPRRARSLGWVAALVVLAGLFGACGSLPDIPNSLNLFRDETATPAPPTRVSTKAVVASPTPVENGEPVPSPTALVLPTPTLLPFPTPTPSPTPTAPPTPLPSPTPSPTPLPTPTPTVPPPTATPTQTPTPTSTPTLTPTPTPTSTPAPTVLNLFGVDFTGGGQEGLAVGAAGIILRTKDSGQTWVPEESGTRNALLDVAFGTREVAYAVGNAGTKGFVLKTANSGENWFVQSEFASTVSIVSFASASFGWVGGGKMVYATTNSGATWTQLPAAPEDVRDISLLRSGQTAIWLGKNGIYRNVSLQPSDYWGNFSYRAFPSPGCPAQAMDFINDDIGWTGGAGILCRTSDGGLTWQRTFTDNLLAYVPLMSGLTLADELTGWAVGGSNIAVTSTDRGATWSPRSVGEVRQPMLTPTPTPTPTATASPTPSATAVPILVLDQEMAASGTFQSENPIKFFIPAGQEFTPTLDTIAKIDVYVVNTGPGDLSLTLRVRSGTVAGPILTTLTQAVATGFDGWATFDILDVAVTPEAVYVIELSALDDNLKWRATSGDLYARGRAIFLGGTVQLWDWWFRVWGLQR